MTSSCGLLKMIGVGEQHDDRYKTMSKATTTNCTAIRTTQV